MVLHVNIFNVAVNKCWTDLKSFFFFLITSSALPVSIYDISVELNISDAVVLNQLRALLSNMIHPITINDYVQISDINITTGKNECIIAVVLLV